MTYTTYDDEIIEDVPVGARVMVIRQSETAKDDDDVVGWSEVQRLLYERDWGPILRLPATENDFFSGRQWENGVDVSAFNTYDFQRQRGINVHPTISDPIRRKITISQELTGFHKKRTSTKKKNCHHQFSFCEKTKKKTLNHRLFIDRLPFTWRYVFRPPSATVFNRRTHLALLAEKGCTGHNILSAAGISIDDIRKTMARDGLLGETGQAKPVTAVLLKP
ncbi:MAG TPA: hypothetical protein PKY77_10850 [Phycisphaerae bacterium]|nr:hypothetical protein [Phycisphaerae bacterium]HRY70078.1 hypothetical protein [Phycisphaerae bacterium]HSA27354.1 hypothetical protein [Phycisphaerae bacterium]